MFEVLLAPRRMRRWRALTRCFSQRERHPRRHNNIKRLTGKLSGRWRFRVGDWRVIHRIDDRLRQVHVLLIAHRSEVYE